MSVAAWPNATGEAITPEAQTAITRTPRRLIQFITVLLTSDFCVLSFLCPILFVSYSFCVLSRPQGTIPQGLPPLQDDPFPHEGRNPVRTTTSGHKLPMLF